MDLHPSAEASPRHPAAPAGECGVSGRANDTRALPFQQLRQIRAGVGKYRSQTRLIRTDKEPLNANSSPFTGLSDLDQSVLV